MYEEFFLSVELNRFFTLSKYEWIIGIWTSKKPRVWKETLMSPGFL